MSIIRSYKGDLRFPMCSVHRTQRWLQGKKLLFRIIASRLSAIHGGKNGGQPNSETRGLASPGAISKFQIMGE